MTFTYDPTTDIGRVRRTIPDKDNNEDTFWTDEEIQSFINDEGDWRRAAALALETMASDSALVMQLIHVQDLRTDGASVSNALLKRAQMLRQQANDSDANDEGGFEIAELVYDDFSYRERIRKQLLRHQL